MEDTEPEVKLDMSMLKWGSQPYVNACASPGRSRGVVGHCCGLCPAAAPAALGLARG